MVNIFLIRKKILHLQRIEMNISNILTIIRIAIIPIIVLCIYLTNPYFGWIAFILFCLAGITDYFDGYLARLRNEVTNFGTFLDPIADKLLVAAVILILTSKGVIKDWDTIPALIILLREITVSGLREYLAGIKISIPVSRIAKAKTFLQLAALGLLILSESNLNLLFICKLFFIGIKVHFNNLKKDKSNPNIIPFSFIIIFE